MVGIRLNDTHTYYDFGFILSSFSVESPSVKSQTVEIAGGDGVLDLTDYFGEPKFKNRKLTFVISKEQNQDEFKEFWAEFQNRFNGQRVTITLDDDIEFYYVGRLSLSYTRNKVITQITINADCEPYKMRHDFTKVVVEGSQIVDLYNLRKKVVPTITTTHPTTLTIEENVYDLDVGVFVIPELELSSGITTVDVDSEGTTTIEYQEGGL